MARRTPLAPSFEKALKPYLMPDPVDPDTKEPILGEDGKPMRHPQTVLASMLVVMARATDQQEARFWSLVDQVKALVGDLRATGALPGVDGEVAEAPEAPADGGQGGGVGDSTPFPAGFSPSGAPGSGSKTVVTGANQGPASDNAEGVPQPNVQSGPGTQAGQAINTAPIPKKSQPQPQKNGR